MDWGRLLVQTVLCLHVADPLLCALQAAGQVKQTFITGSAVESHLLWAPIVRKQILSTFLPFLSTVDIDSWARLGDLGLFPRISGMVTEDFSLQLKREKMKYVWVENSLDGVHLVNKSTITVGSYDFWNHWITYVTELACKNGNLFKFLRQRGTFSQENIPGELLMCGTTHVSLHKHRSPNNSSKLKQSSEKPAKSAEQLQNTLLTTK